MAHVQTVLGPIDPADLGVTLPHEHTQIALWQIPARWDYWQLTRDEPVILEELGRFRAAGGGGLVDLTLPGVGRDPDWLRAIARASGLHVVMGCGWYRGAYYPAEARIDRRTVDDLADELVREATDGLGADAIKPGIIGEIGTDKPWVSAAEERVHRAAARAARRTGLTITTHGVLSPVGFDQLRIFEAEGADPGRVIVGHAEGDAAAAVALKAWRALRCRDGGRIDVRNDSAGRPQFVEVNPLAGLNPEHSDLCFLAGFKGLSYQELIGLILESFLKRHPELAARKAAA
jgi:predicted metal-dependent phosphotriesterase family hydrolase